MKSPIRLLSTGLLISGTALLAGCPITSVVKAPITPDGDVAGAPTDLVLNLDKSLDPAFSGRTLLANCAVRVTLPHKFVRVEPVQDVFTPDCAPGNFQCTTAVFLQGWPQHPILPHFPVPPLGPATEYMLTLEGHNTLVFTALKDISAPNTSPAPGPGLKQIHLINGFLNPTRPGHYPIHLEFTDGPGCSPAEGVQFVHILPKVRPSVEVTSALNPGAPNTIYQAAAANDAAPFPWDLLLWDRKGEPMLDVSVHMVNSRRALLKQGHRTVGHIRIHVPHGAKGQSVAGGPSTPFNAPIKSVPTALLNVQFTAGSASGRYTTEVRLKGGNAIEFFVDVP